MYHPAKGAAIMTLEEIVAAYARDLCKDLTDEVVEDVTDRHNVYYIDGQTVENPWQEFCIHQRMGQEPSWTRIWFYVASIAREHIDKLPSHVQHAIWRQTRSGLEWNEEEDGSPALDIDPVVTYVMNEYVLAKASEMSEADPEIRAEMDRWGGAW
jgi:hypothetical protein